MSHFIFKAKHSGGAIYTGEKDATDRYELYRLLRASGDEILSFKEKASARPSAFSMAVLSRVKTVEKINFARNLGSMLEAGLALSRALNVLLRQTRNKALQKVLTGIIADIDRGASFSDALAKFPKVFPPLFISMAHAGEQSGTLADSLKIVASQMDASFTLTRRIRGAMMYPAVIVTAMVIIAILMMMFVVPTLMKTFTDLNVPLPVTTQIVLGISNVLQNYGLLVVIVFLLIVAVVWYWSKTPPGKSLLHSVDLKIPLVGGLVQEVNTARTARTLSSLLSSGVDVVESMNITSAVVQNVHFREVLKRAGESIKKGEPMSKIFAENIKLYPVFFVEMVDVGEETGKTGEMLMGVAKYYEEDIEQRTKDMSTVIEPFLILLIGAAVGFFAISMIQPIYSLVNAI